MDKGGVGKAVFVHLLFDDKINPFIIFMKNIVINVRLVKLAGRYDFANVGQAKSV